MRKFLLLALYLLLGICFKITAQGNGSDGALTVNGTTIINTTKSIVTLNASVGATTINVASAAGFSSSDLILIIEMQGSNRGKHEVCTVASVTGTSITFAPGLTNAYTSSLAQIIRIPQYTNVTINSGGTLTAPAWDGSTGGILAFYANGTVNIAAGGKIDATGLGGIGGTGGTGGTGGAGGARGLGGSGGAAGGNGASSGGASGGAGGDILGLLAGGNGGSGASAGSAGTAGTAGTAGSGPGAGSAGSGGTNGSSFPGSIMFGGGGGGGNGGNGGTGAGGGGGGGGGSVTSGNNGTAGSNGGDGGNGGNGGKGGGIIFIKANIMTGNGQIVSNGVAGTNGTNGTAGGNGGNGGRGGQLLSGLSALNGGGGGGSGKGANGGAGGSAGGGGGGGAIYVETINYSGWLGTVSTVAGSSGSVGTGGAGGAAGTPGAGGAGHIIGEDGLPGGNGGAGSAGPNGAIATTGIGVNLVLPVELLSFTATVFDENYIQLDWATSTETGSDFFSIERSEDGKNFTEISQIKSAGNSISTIQYSAKDKSPLKGISYYRLAQIDLDGQISYSSIISATNNTDSDLQIYPNPIEITSALHIKDNGLNGGTYIIRFYNNIGELAYSNTIVSENHTDYSMPLPNCLLPGTYYVTITSDMTQVCRSLILK